MKRAIELPVLMSLLLGVAWCTAAGAQQTLAYRDLVDRMADLEQLAVLPPEGETCRQWSSFDRGSRYDEASGKYVNWGANNDGPQFIRQEDGRGVMAEMEGPGCIWRIWSALPQKGHVKIYLDGREQPAVDLPFQEYFTGKTPPLNFPMLSYALEDLGCRGKNLYLPIPYQKSCKIVAQQGWGRYYHITYTTFAEGTKVPTFTSNLTDEDTAALKDLDTFFREKLGTDPAGPRQGEKHEKLTVKAPAGKTTELLTISGPRAITALKVKMKFADREEQMAALRKLSLRITFDGQSEPAVWCPLGDFFGTAPGENRYKSLPTGMTEDGFYAYWYMPFAERAVVQLLSDDATEREMHLEIVHAPLDRPFSELGHFHCKWHRDIFALSKDRWPDWTMLNTRGRGRFCGVMLHVWNPRGGWWGEGDEKFFVDGEKFPSTIGTGSEDYFGYAWGHAGLFQRPFHCQTMTQNNRGHQSLLRWQVADSVPFQKSFEGCIEKYPGNDRTLLACTACWYLDPKGIDPLPAVPVDRRHGYWVAPPLAAGGYRIIGKPDGNVRTQGMQPFRAGKWHNGDQLFWSGGKPGQQLQIAVPVDKAGKYQADVVLTKARDYAVVQLYLDGKKVGDPIDLYNPDVVNTGPISLGVHDLSAGAHKLAVEIVGANEKAIKAYMFGLDRVLLKPM